MKKCSTGIQPIADWSHLIAKNVSLKDRGTIFYFNDSPEPRKGKDYAQEIITELKIEILKVRCIFKTKMIFFAE